MLHISLNLYEGQLVRLYGPMQVRIKSGQVVVLGAVFNKGDEFKVYRYRSYGLKAAIDSKLEILLGEGGSIEKPLPGEEPLEQWIYTVDHLMRNDCKRFMVLGQVDAGKSSIAALIANRGILRGLKVGIIDADVGQSNIGPPGCVAASRVDRHVLWLRELTYERLRFIGYITPQRGERRITASIVDLSNWLEKNDIDVVVIDTDGWIQGINSLEYKLEAAHLSNIDSLVVVGDKKLYNMVKNSWGRRGCGVVYLETPQVKKTREREDRRALRSEAYRRFLEPARARSLSLKEVSVLGSCFFSGDRLADETAEGFSAILRTRVLAASETYDTVYVVTDGPADPAGIERLSAALNKQIYILDINNTKGALLALVGPQGYEVAIGLLESIDFEKDTVNILTPYEGPVTGIIIGGTRLGPGLEEQGRPLRCVI